MINRYYQKHKEKNIKIFLKKKNTKREKNVKERNQILPKDQKKKLPEDMKNHYLAHKKIIA